ncbi:MAG: ABC transporter substrate-binding protein [Actinomycetota bacterium]|nr:ABC transporter substrate-binding protein [Actinomycetota bacterium]
MFKTSVQSGSRRAALSVVGVSVMAVLVAACSSSGTTANSSGSSPSSAGQSTVGSSSAGASGSSAAGTPASPNSGSASSGAPAAGKTVDINYWTSSSKAVIDYLDSHFNQTHPGIKVTGQYVASADNTTAKVVAALKSDTEPNILIGQDPSELPLFSQSGKVVDLTSALKTETDALYPGIRSGLFYKGKQLGFALGGVGNYVLFYNKDDFAKAGIAGPPTTWAELTADAVKLTDAAKHHYGVYVPLGASEWISYTWESLLVGNGGQLLNSDGSKVAFNSPAGLAALTTWTDLVQKEKAAPTTSYAQGGSFDGAPAFASGAVSMIIEGQFALSEFTKINYGVALMPAGSSGKSSSGIGIGVAVVFNKGQDVNTAAETFVKWLGQPEQGAYLTAQSGGLPSAPNQLDQPVLKAQIAKQPTYNLFADQLKFGQVRPTVPAYAAISQALSDNINKALTGNETPQQALAAAETAGNAAIANSGS